MSETELTSPEAISIKDFFEKIPPGRAVAVSDIADRSNLANVNLPVLELHCDTASCDGKRFFRAHGDNELLQNQTRNFFFFFVCRNCNENIKTYAVRVTRGRSTSGEMFKFGEVPAFGPPTPARVISLIGPEKEYYLKGVRTENQDLGIAAFAYYRRVVENQKNRIFDEIIRVAQKIGASSEQLADLEAAKTETQFSKAVGVIKHGIPQALLINGHNPLTLLHSALSEGMHAQTDEECLVLATSIRVVLADLADRLGNALKDHAELNTAVSRLLKPKTQKP